jgi:hypothetical protein
VGETRRLNVNLPEGSYEEIRALADRSGRSISEIVRTGLGLVSIAMEEASRNNYLAVSSSEGKLLRQIVLPK